MTTPASPTIPTQTSGRQARRALDLVLSLYVAATFVVLWVGLAMGVATGGGILDDIWAWLTGLPPVVAMVAWILILPVAVGAWAWTADLAPLAMGAVVIGLVAWTLVAAVGLARSLRGR